jgi:hypothetical protein
MARTQDLVPLRQLLETYATRIATSLQRSMDQADPRGIIRSGSWSNAAGLINAFVSYYPAGDTSAEAIEAIISLAPSGAGMKLNAEICRSNGEVLAEIAERNLPPMPTTALMPEVVQLAEGLQAELVARLAMHVSADLSEGAPSIMRQIAD